MVDNNNNQDIQNIAGEIWKWRYPDLPFDHHGTVDDASWDRIRESILRLAGRISSLLTPSPDWDKVSAACPNGVPQGLIDALTRPVPDPEPELVVRLSIPTYIPVTEEWVYLEVEMVQTTAPTTPDEVVYGNTPCKGQPGVFHNPVYNPASKCPFCTAPATSRATQHEDNLGGNTAIDESATPDGHEVIGYMAECPKCHEFFVIGSDAAPATPATDERPEICNGCSTWAECGGSNQEDCIHQATGRHPRDTTPAAPATGEPDIEREIWKIILKAEVKNVRHGGIDEVPGGSVCWDAWEVSNSMQLRRELIDLFHSHRTQPSPQLKVDETSAVEKAERDRLRETGYRVPAGKLIEVNGLKSKEAGVFVFIPDESDD